MIHLFKIGKIFLNGFKYWHNNSKLDDFSEEETRNFIETYTRRYIRLIDHLKNHSNITILSVNHFDNIYTKITKQLQVYKLFNLLQSHNINIRFIAVNYGEELHNTPNLEFVNLPLNYDLEFKESKFEFSKILNDYVKSTL